MRKFFTFLAAALLIAVSCSKGNENSEVETDGKVFYASMENGTKVYADEDLSLLWNENDRISIFNKSTVNDQYMFTGEDGDNSGSFEEVPANPTVEGTALEHIYAVYPFSQDNSINDSGTQITVNLPAVQTYLEHSFGKGANTMVAVSDDSFLGFKNVCGYLKFRFYGDDETITGIILEGNNGEKISGKAYVYPVMEGTPTISMDETATGSITLSCPEPVTLGTSSTDFTEFIFVIPPTVFSKGFKVSVTDANGVIFEKASSRSLEIKRNKMEAMGVMRVIANYGDAEREDYIEEEW